MRKPIDLVYTSILTEGWSPESISSVGVDVISGLNSIDSVIYSNTGGSAHDCHCKRLNLRSGCEVLNHNLDLV